jgi:ELWxxDGT repeat protein
MHFEPLEDRRLLAGAPELLAEINPAAASDPAEFVNAGGVVFFRADDGTNGPELWKTDGTTAGTMMVKDIAPAAAGSNPQYLTAVGDTLFFAADDGTGGVELWKSDGTPGGTVMVKDINPGGSSSPAELINVGGTLYFRADDGGGAELWKSDGTTLGTVMVMDIHPAAGSNPNYLTNVGGKLFFGADDGTNGSELWMHDPGTSSTALVKDINPGSGSSFPGFFGAMADVGGTLLFSASDPANGFELWKSDGTGPGTMIVKDIRGGPGNSFPFEMANVGGTLFFTANDGANGFELWKSNGTLAGTTLVADINPLGDSGPSDFANLNGTLFFRANNGTLGVELWSSDGTPGGTAIVLDINPAGSSTPLYLTNVNGTLYFRATRAADGTELWKSDGSPGGTSLAMDIAPGAASSNPQNLANVNGTLFFAAAAAAANHEPWIARAAATNVEGTHLFYNDSTYDGDDPAAGAADDSAIATDKVAYVPGSGFATFANVSSYSKGINGVMIDLAGAHGALSAADFTLQAGLSNMPGNWPAAPAPVSVTVRAGAGAGGSDRVELIWASGAIEKKWLQVVVKANFNTNLAAPYSFIYGSYIGETGFGNLPDALTVDAVDQILTRNSQGISEGVTNPFDFNRDALVSASDEVIVRNNQGFLPLLNATGPPGTTILARYLFYNESVFDGETAGVDPSDDSAIATDKTAYLPGSGAATFANMTSYARGINGVMIDVLGSHPNITVADFTFKIGANNAPGSWLPAPSPAAVVVRPGAGVSGSDRVELIWASGAIQDAWLEVTMAANANTGLSSPDVFYFGSRVGDTGSDVDPTAATTDATDQVETRNNQGVALFTANPYDFDRDGLVSATDELIARNNIGFTLKIDLAAPPAAPMAAPSASDDEPAAEGQAVDLAIVDEALLDELPFDGEDE